MALCDIMPVDMGVVKLNGLYSHIMYIPRLRTPMTLEATKMAIKCPIARKSIRVLLSCFFLATTQNPGRVTILLILFCVEKV